MCIYVTTDSTCSKHSGRVSKPCPAVHIPYSNGIKGFDPLPSKFQATFNTNRGSRADSETRTADSETNGHADSETKIRKLKPRIRKLGFGN